MRAQGEERGAGIGPPAGVFVSLAGVSAALTILFLSTLRSATVTGASPTPAGGGGQDVVGLLERLDALHRTGSLSDEEFERAKQEILRRGGS